MKTAIAANPEDADERCRQTLPSGQQCPSRRLSDDAFCQECRNGVNSQNTQIVSAKAELDTRLQTKNYKIRTVRDVQDFLEDTMNGIMKGSVKRDKAAPLALFFPLAHKIAKELEAQNGPYPNNSISMTFTERSTSVVMKMTDAEMDAYIAGDRAFKDQMIEQMKARGSAQETVDKDNNVVDVSVEDIQVQDLPIDHKALAKISDKTDIPITTKQAVQLFGKHVGVDMGSSFASYGENFDATGFSEIFEKKPEALPLEARTRPHKFKGKFEVVEGAKNAVLQYTCLYCGKKVPNVDKPKDIRQEHCEKAPIDEA